MSTSMHKTARADSTIAVLAFVLRCTGAATLAQILAIHAGLPFPVWAAMSAVIVSQDELRQTNAMLAARIVGTAIGIVVATGVAASFGFADGREAVEVAIAVALCALFAQWRPDLRVCMWTAPLVLLSERHNTPFTGFALDRGYEVMLGALVGGAVHWLLDSLVYAFSTRLHRHTMFARWHPADPAESRAPHRLGAQLRSTTSTSNGHLARRA